MITIINIISKNPEYIRIQYNNIKERIKDPFKYVVFNNSMFNEMEYRSIEQMCKTLGVEHVPVEKNESVNSFTGKPLYVNNNWIANDVTPPATYALNYLSVIESKKISGHICLIHSDMFFLKDISLIEMLGDNDMAFVPQYRGDIKYIWDGFCIFGPNTKIEELNWMYSDIDGQRTDCGGSTFFYLKKYNPKIKYIESWNITDYNQGIFDTHLNGNVRYKFTNSETLEFLSGTRISDLRSFEYESEYENYGRYYTNKFLKIKSYLDNKEVNLPNPYWIDILMCKDSDDFLIIHYKSGSNYLEFQNQNYNDLKLKELLKIIK